MPGVMLMEEIAVASFALVVESRPEVARSVSAALAGSEMEAFVVSDGQTAVAAAEALNPDVVLIDLTLEPLDGWFVLASVGALPDRPLLVVRVGDASEADRAIALGADAWVDDDVHVVCPAGRLAFLTAA